MQLHVFLQQSCYSETTELNYFTREQEFCHMQENDDHGKRGTNYTVQ